MRKKIKKNEMVLVIFDNGSFSICMAEGRILEDKKVSIRPNFELNIDGEEQIFLNESGFHLEKLTEEKNTVTLTYACPAKNIMVEVILDYSKGRNVITQKNVITNMGTETIKLTRFSSAFMEDIGRDDSSKAWYQKDGIRIHICHNKWQGEGQWKTYSPDELGLYPTSTHEWERESFRVQSTGSWSTANFYPLIMIEDTETGQCWFMESEGSHNWMMKIAAYGGYEAPQLTLEATGCDEGNGGWFYDLMPGESYSTERAFFGTVMGGFEAAVAALNSFKRSDSLIRHHNDIPPVIFNDYMDCVWGNQKPELLQPLIEKAAELGCEIFCIDGGWYENVKGAGLGDWIPKKAYYDKVSLEDIICKISELGMIPGIWFEWETCSDTAEGFHLDENCILKRYDRQIGGTRCFYNFKNEKVRNYLKGRVDYFYRLGVRYIKNDYNHSLGVGCTNNYDGNSPAQGLIENCEAFYEFLEELYQEFPGLIIENCGSGALRSDNKTLRRFALQSISDQELYWNNPSILMGSLAQFPPEKVGIWAYPYPVMLPECKDFHLTDQYIEKMADGRQTTFNMVTAMMGVLYLSGRIDLCDVVNQKLIEEAITVYKNNRIYISRSRPIYPLGMCGINKEEVMALGLLSPEKLILAVWNLKKEVENIQIDLEEWLHDNSEITDIYPKDSTEVSMNRKKLHCRLKPDSAFYIAIRLEEPPMPPAL